jgi:hypothetical protein
MLLCELEEEDRRARLKWSATRGRPKAERQDRTMTVLIRLQIKLTEAEPSRPEPEGVNGERPPHTNGYGNAKVRTKATVESQLRGRRE